EFSIKCVDCSECAAAERGETAHDRIKYRLQLARRAGDDAQHLRCGPLLLQRLVALALRTRKLFFKVCIGVLRHRGSPLSPFRRPVESLREARERLNGSRAGRTYERYDQLLRCTLNFRNGSKPVRLRTSKCFPVYP